MLGPWARFILSMELGFIILLLMLWWGLVPVIWGAVCFSLAVAYMHTKLPHL